MAKKTSTKKNVAALLGLTPGTPTKAAPKRVDDDEDERDEFDEEETNVVQPEVVEEDDESEATEEDGAENIVVQPETSEVVETDDDVPEVTVSEDDEDMSLSEAFINFLFRFDRQMTHALIARMMVTDLKDVADTMFIWFEKESPSHFTNYDSAKDHTVNFLIEKYEQFEKEPFWADLVAHWFCTTIGLRRVR